MEQIKVLFFGLISFFTIEDGRLAADKTTVTINPVKQEITIVQENLFTVIQSDEDKILVLEQWDKLVHREEKHIAWANELDSFPVKNLNLKPIEKGIQPHLKLSYSKETDLRALGVWYDKERKQFSINHIPQQNINTKEGKLIGNYWVFKGDSTFSFTMEPFYKMPENYLKLKIYLDEFLAENAKE